MHAHTPLPTRHPAQNGTRMLPLLDDKHAACRWGAHASTRHRARSTSRARCCRAGLEYVHRRVVWHLSQHRGRVLHATYPHALSSTHTSHTRTRQHTDDLTEKHTPDTLDTTPTHTHTNTLSPNNHHHPNSPQARAFLCNTRNINSPTGAAT
jgi:hypothetical protein